MTYQESIKHHYVPQFLLKHWAINGEINGYYWNKYKTKLDYNRKGAKAFCNKEYLLSFEGEAKKRDAIERGFQIIDGRGSAVIRRFLNGDIEFLSADEKCDFAIFLMSLITRDPAAINDRKNYLETAIDSNLKIRGMLKNLGLSLTPLEFYAWSDLSIKNETVSGTLRFTHDLTSVNMLINLNWHVVRLGDDDGTFVLADQPLVRSIDDCMHIWLLPLAPKVAFVADARLETNYRKNLQEIAQKFNITSVASAKRYVFCKDASHKYLLRKYLPLSLTDRMDIAERSLCSAAVD